MLIARRTPTFIGSRPVMAVMAGLLAAVPAASSRAADAGAWETLYSVPQKDRYLNVVWLNDDGSWRAGGKDVLVLGDKNGVRINDIPGYVVHAFGEPSPAAVVAVGTRQAIWEEYSDGFKLVFEQPGRPGKGKDAAKDTLDGFGKLDPTRPQWLVAYGSSGLVVGRGPSQPWRVMEGTNLARLGSVGPEHKPPAGCRPAAWKWFNRVDGLQTCADGAAYLYAGETPTAAGRLPAACRTSLRAAARDEDKDKDKDRNDVYVACGQKARIWRHRVGVDDWSEVTGVSDVRAVRARKGCLLVGTARQVLRRCAISPPAASR